jgi:hypothetical protein
VTEACIDLVPIAVLPDLLPACPFNASYPTAVQYKPPVSAPNASAPTTVFLDPVVLASKAF